MWKGMNITVGFIFPAQLGDRFGAGFLLGIINFNTP